MAQVRPTIGMRDLAAYSTLIRPGRNPQPHKAGGKIRAPLLSCNHCSSEVMALVFIFLFRL